MDRAKEYIRRKSIERKEYRHQVRQVHHHRGKKRDIRNVQMKKHQNRQHVPNQHHQNRQHVPHQCHQCHQNISHKIPHLK